MIDIFAMRITRGERVALPGLKFAGGRLIFRGMKKFLKLMAVFLAAGTALGGVAVFLLYQWAASDLPSITKLGDYRPPLATTVLARDGSLMGLFYNEKRFLVSLGDMSPHLPKAFLAAEDSEFYNHSGVDPAAIVRAFIINLRSGKSGQGGSTITQQVIKRLLLSPERTYERKFKEAILAYRLERYLTKDEILTIYMNQTFFGANAYGVEAASRTYFGKHAKDLTIAQSAVIAGLPQAPSTHNPYKNPDAARTRQLYVLGQMRDKGWITADEYQKAVDEPLVYQAMAENRGWEGAWYLEEVRRQLIDMFSEGNAKAMGWDLPLYGEQAVYELGLTVQTAMDPPAQLAGDAALRKGLEAADKRHGWRGPLEKLSPEKMREVIAQSDFTPSNLRNGAWARGVVTAVTDKGADVRLGSYKGYVDVKTMSWARVPNVKISAAGAPAVRDARKVLAPGDLIWVSAYTVPDPKTKQAPPFEPEKYSKETVLPLALQQYPDVQGALVSLEPENGDVVCMIGGYSFAESQFNRVTQAKRQPGSSFKPVVYSAAMDNGFTPASVVMDAPVVQVDETTSRMWRPSNFEKNFRGPMTLRAALALSRNLVTVRLAMQMGVGAVVQRAKDLGLEPNFPEYLSISLGSVEVTPLNMAQAYATFASGGVRVKPRMILSIRDFWGNALYAPEPSMGEQGISPQNAFIMNYLLKEVINAGTGGKARVLGRPVAGKTGTSNDEQDAWFVGFTPHLSTAVYVGYDQVRPMGKQETGGNAALPIFVDFAKVAFEAYPPDDFPEPPDIVYHTINRESGQPSSSGISVPFYAGTGPGSGPALEEGDIPAASIQGEDLLKQLF